MTKTRTDGADVQDASSTETREAVSYFCEDWEIGEDAVWVRAGMDRLDPLRRSGWKLHLSSLPDELSLLLKTALPVLAAAGAPFKAIRNAGLLEDLNDGRLGLSQVGKALTIYPASEVLAAEIAEKLAKALHEFGGPHVPTDLRYAADAPVYFRFGPYDGRFRVDGLGRKRRILWHPEHGDVIDPADGGDTPSPKPQHLPDRAPYDHLDFLRDHYLLIKMLHLSAKGGVFIALDPESPDLGRLLIKTARQGAHADPQGRDAVWALKREHALLEKLDGAPGLPVAGRIECDGDAVAALIRPFYNGMTFFEKWTMVGSATPGAKLEQKRHLDSLMQCLSDWHTRGVVMRDLAPANLLIEGNTLRLLDVELAYEIDGDDPPFRRGTEGFYNPEKTRETTPTPEDDHYAVDALHFMVDAGAMPGWYRGERPALDVPVLSEQLKARAGAILGRIESEAIRLEDAPADATELNVYSGLAGGLLVAMEHMPRSVVARIPERRLRKLAERFTEASEQIAHLPGLYFGGGGIGLALVALGHYREERGIADAGDRVLDTLRHTQNPAPDLTHGIAGYAAATLAAHRITGEVRYLNWAVAAGQRLVKQGIAMERGMLWPWPEGHYGTLSTAKLYGFAHGAAGVSWVLLQLHKATGEEKFLEAALGGLNAIRGAVKTVPGADHAVCWPCSAADDSIWNAWCHGGPGIIKALAAGLRARDHDTDRALLARAAQGVAATNNGHYCLCHGVASRLDAYMDALPWLEGDALQAVETAAARDAALLAAMEITDAEDPVLGDPEARGLMTGAIGVARVLLQFDLGGDVEGPYGKLLP